MTQHNAAHPAASTPQPTPHSDPGADTHPALCPYCGHENPPGAIQCIQCRGLFEPLSRQASQNAMGAWFVRDPQRPFQPGMAFDTLRTLVARKRIGRRTILRGPTTRQFWAYAEDTPGVATLLGICHACHAQVRPDEFLCRNCNSTLSPPTDRQHLGLAPVRLLPGQGTPEEIAQNWTAPPPDRKTTAKQGESAPAGVTMTGPRPATPAPLQTTTTTNVVAPESNTQRRARQQMLALRRWLGVSLAVNAVLLIVVLITISLSVGGAGNGAESNEAQRAALEQTTNGAQSNEVEDIRPVERAQTRSVPGDEIDQKAALERARELLREQNGPG